MMPNTAMPNARHDTNLYKVSKRSRSDLVSRTAIHHSPCICKTPISYGANIGSTNSNSLINPSWQQNKCEANDYKYCACKCDKVCEYTDRVYNENQIDSINCAAFGFVMNLLDGLESEDEKYIPEEDFHDINVTISLLGLYGYKIGNKFVALPFLKDDTRSRTALHNFLKQYPKWASANSIDILNSPYDKRWDTAINMFRQILNHLNSLRQTLTTAQRDLFDIAIEAWKRGANDPDLEKLDQPYP